MHWFTAFVVFIMIWWTVLFAVLPIGTRPVADADAASGWRGAPDQARIPRKLIMTTIISLALWGVAMLLIRGEWLSFRTPEF